jgi:GntR family transcriptional regulator
MPSAEFVPLYRQVMNDIRAKIASGEWPPDHRLPSTRELADHYGVSNGTVRAAVDRLLDAGVLRGHQGLAVYVARSGEELE